MTINGNTNDDWICQLNLGSIEFIAGFNGLKLFTTIERHGDCEQITFAHKLIGHRPFQFCPAITFGSSSTSFNWTSNNFGAFVIESVVVVTTG